ncbi:proteasome accessory factor PafA2 [Mycobacterium intracellulare 1956]|uniref:Proteasome accessory factor PafA2 n=1 Tax=Mycobacterium intracellulare 1956 TaxID=1299331 RepID=X8CVF3_MYCIT|nr:proteasome accessory factor PafA2 [Mycobacterium intracellulare 1956]
MSRQTPFSAIIAGLTPFLVSRQVVTGSGRVGIGPSGDEPGFQLSQRSDYIEVEVGLETTLKRGIINTRDEPHADADRYRRLHVIIGDANLAETSTYLKLGTTSLVLDLIEEGPAHGIDLSDLALARPVHAVHAISRDPSLRAAVALADGRELTGLALQRVYLDRVAKLVDSRDPDPRAADIVETWAHVLDQLERDPMECAELLDWPAKLRLLEGFRQRENLSWSAPRLHLVDLQYSDVRLDKGLYNRLVARGSMKRLVSEHQVLEAVDSPPTDTRAYFRGECLRRFGADIAAASWDSVIFDLGGDSLVRIPTLEPLRAAKRTWERCWTRCTARRNWSNNSPASRRFGRGTSGLTGRVGKTNGRRGWTIERPFNKPRQRRRRRWLRSRPSVAAVAVTRTTSPAARPRAKSAGRSWPRRLTICSTRLMTFSRRTPRTSCGHTSKRAASDLAVL